MICPAIAPPPERADAAGVPQGRGSQPEGMEGEHRQDIRPRAGVRALPDARPTGRYVQSGTNTSRSVATHQTVERFFDRHCSL